MRPYPTALLCLWLVTVLSLRSMRAREAEDPAGKELRELAARAVKKEAWRGLRRYAESAKDSERRGLAYFALGYHEYQASEYLPAAADLRRAAQSEFSLADLAQFYRSEAASEGNEPGQAIEALEGFGDRYPKSSLRFGARAFVAKLLLEAGHPERAIEDLTTDPGVRQRPSLTLLLGQAYQQAQKLEEAARAYQDIYYSFPTAPEAKAASEALEQLEAQLGPHYPHPTEDVQTARAATLFEKSRFDEALREYDALIRTHPQSPLAGWWRVGRARCLLRAKRALEAVEALKGSESHDPEIDAQRLATLVEAGVQLQDTTGMDQALEQLRALYPQSPSYALALFSAGSFYGRQGDWESAARYYRPLAELFVGMELGRDAHWRVAWTYYLQRDRSEAEKAFLDHLTRYPASPHLPAALYWLGRLAEERGAVSDARGYYELLEKRYVRHFYALQASPRLKGLRSSGLDEMNPNNSGAIPAREIAEATQRIPKRRPLPIPPCGSGSSSEALRPFLALRALSLDALAEEYSKTAVSEGTTAPDLFLARSRLFAEQRDYSSALLEAGKVIPNLSEFDFSELPKELWDLLYPRLYWKLVKRQATASGLDPYVVMGLIRQESAFNPRAISHANARGLMQVLPKTASRGRPGRRAVARRLYDPAYNVRVGCMYLRSLLDAYDRNLAQALAAYNAGEIRVESWREKRSFTELAEFVESIPFSETRVYVEAVLRDAEVYRQLMNGLGRFGKCN